MSSKNTKASSVTERDTLAKVRDHISTIETRLKRADSANKRSITALRKSFDALADQAGAGKSNDLDLRVNQLANQLDQQLKQTRSDVSAKLQSALTASHGSTDQLQKILSASRAASERMTQGEIRQAEAIQKVNQHIARLAAALDARLQTETRERLALQSQLNQRLDGLEAITEQRIMAVEDHSAEAITGIGERIAVLSAEMAKRNESNDIRTQGLIQERVYEVALDQQKELEAHRADIDYMLAQKEAQQDNTLAPLHRSIATLSARIEALEYGMANVTHAAPVESIPPFPDAPSAMTQPDEDSAVFQSHEQGDPQLQNGAGAGAVAASLMADDAFSPTPEPVLPAAVHNIAPAHVENYGGANADVTEAQPNPYADLAKGEFAEFNPNLMNAYPQATHDMTAMAPPPFENAPSAAPSYDAPQLAQPEFGAAISPYSHDQNTAQFSSDQFYNDTNGGYGAEPTERYAQAGYDHATDHSSLDQSMNSARPGAESPSSDYTKKSLGLSKRTLRTAASAAALVAVVTAGALVAKNTLLDKAGDTPSVTAQNPTQAPQDRSSRQVQTTPAYDVTLSEPTGSLSDGTTVADSRPEVTEFKTLEAALEGGDPIAQLQYGQILMQKGNAEDAAKYFRKSASQGQAAAQYYLGDMYASGEGVTADLDQARKLTQMAAQSGHRIAMYDLALYFADDAQRGGPQADQAIRSAAGWFRKAADFGMTDAQFNLAALHSAPSGSLSNPLEAYVWYSIAAKQGDQEAATQANTIRSLLPGDALGRAEARIAGFSPASIDKSANGIFTDLAWNKKPPRTNPDVAMVQSLLTGLGFEAGVADGAMGPKTREAIRAFERSNGLPETGQVNPELIEKLQSTSGA